MKRWEAKLISLFGMFLVIFIFMALPIKVSAVVNRQGDNAGTILGMIRCFAGGVFLGTVMLHMIPEVHDQINEFLLEPQGIDYPIAEVVLVGGFFLICVFERLVLYIHARKLKGKVEMVALSGQVMVHTHVGQAGGTPSALHVVMDDAEGIDNKGFTMEDSNMAAPLPTKTALPVQNGTMVVNGSIGKDVEVAGVTESKLDMDLSKTRSIILVLALSFECIFDGLGVGLQLTETGVWNMFIAIISHEFVIAFCLGIELVKSHSSKRVLLASFVYALMPPVGCSLGIILTEVDLEVNEDTIEVVSGLLIALSAGIFLYCTFIGMLGEELIQDATFKKILMTAIGCGIMAGLAALPEGDPEEEEEILTTMVMVTE